MTPGLTRLVAGIVMLMLCVPMQARAQAPPPPPQDASRLLSNAELALPSEDVTPAVDSAAGAWVRSNAHPIRSLSSTNYGDLAFLAPLLAGKRIVQLGESGHGVREFNLAKVRLIKYLHAELGYDVIAFESSLFACELAGHEAATASAISLMRSCIFGVWHTEEVLPLFEYIRETQRTSRPLILSGFDVQHSANFDSDRPIFLRAVIGSLDTAMSRRVMEIEAQLDEAARQYQRQSGQAQRALEQVGAFYDSVGSWISSNEQELVAALQGDTSAVALARRTIASRAFLARLTGAGGTEAFALRDRGMADNIDFLLKERYPGKKIIVWAHNAHVRHQGFGGDTSVTVPSPRVMGSWVAERHRRELYTIGFYMYRGSSAANDMSIMPVLRPADGSLEAILDRAPWKYAFIDMSRARAVPGAGWMARPIQVKEWGRNPHTIVPRGEYDGLVFIDETSPPKYMSWRRPR